MTLVKMLGQQSEDVRKTLEVLQESLDLIKAGVKANPKPRSQKDTISQITSLIPETTEKEEEKTLPKKPSWFDKPIEKPSEKTQEATTQTEDPEDDLEDKEPSFDLGARSSLLRKSIITLQSARKTCNPEKFPKCISTLEFYCKKIIEKPTNKSFR